MGSGWSEFVQNFGKDGPNSGVGDKTSGQGGDTTGCGKGQTMITDSEAGTSYCSGDIDPPSTPPPVVALPKNQAQQGTDTFDTSMGSRTPFTSISPLHL